MNRQQTSIRPTIKHRITENCPYCDIPLYRIIWSPFGEDLICWNRNCYLYKTYNLRYIKEINYQNKHETTTPKVIL